MLDFTDDPLVSDTMKDFVSISQNLVYERRWDYRPIQVTYSQTRVLLMESLNRIYTGILYGALNDTWTVR